jgi:hypothetical protein
MHTSLSPVFARRVVVSTALFCAAFTFGPSLSLGQTLYNIPSMVLDGGAGENTYGVSSGTGAVGLVLGGGNTTLTVSNTTQTSTLIGNFADTNLAIGDTLRLSFAFTATGASSAAQNLRFGFFNSNTTPFTANALSGGTVGGNDTGYFVRYTPTASVNAADNYVKRDGLSNPTASVSPPSTSLVANITTTAVGLINVPTTGFFQLERTASGVLISSQVGGSIISSFLDTTSPFTAFNQVGTFFNGSTTPSFAFTDFTVALTTSAIPEPSTYAAGAGLVVLGFVALRRRFGPRV